VALAPDRRGVVLSGALAAAFLVAQQVAGKATRDTLFLIQYPVAALPAAMMAASLFSIGAALGVSRLLATRAPRRAVPALVAANAALLLAEFLLVSSRPDLAALVLYVHVAASGASLISGYWSVVNERFDPWMAKRVVGRLGLGASLGSVAGGLLSWAVARTLPLPAMLLLTAAMNVAALAALVRFAGEASPDLTPEGAGTPQGWLAAPYLRQIALVVALGGGTEALLEFVFKARAAAAIADGPRLLAFLAAFHTAMGLVGFAFHTLLTRSTLEVLGLAGSVALRPAAVAAASAVALFDPRLWTAALGRGCHDVLTNSLFRAGYELLYTPLPAAEKRRAKQVLDVAFERVGSLLGGAATFGAVRLFEAPDRALLPLAGVLSLLALGLTRRLHLGYVEALGQSLRAGKVRLDPAEVLDSTTRLTLIGTQADPHATGQTLLPEAAPPSPDPLLSRIAELRSGQPERIRRLLRERDALEPALVPHLLPLLARDDLYADVLRALRRLAARATGQLLDALLDPGVEPQVRRRLPRVLKACPTQRAVDGLLLGLAAPESEVRVACALALAALARAPGLRFPADPVFAAARRELEAGPDPPLGHVFTLLSLVLEREPLEVAARALQGQDRGLKGTALEYLENVLPAELRSALRPHVGVALEASRPRPRQEVLAELERRVEGQASGRKPTRRA
jgi:hypothetical protein